MDIQKFINDNKALRDVYEKKETIWFNPDYGRTYEKILGMEDIKDAQLRLERFKPLIAKLFPETADAGGIIESPLREIPDMKKALNIEGKLYLKMDSHLPVAGSIKARGGVYEVLKFAEDLALKNGFINLSSDYSTLANPEIREFFGKYSIQVGSTGNLGLSIGITSRALGFKAIVHMSHDAKKWKKDLLMAKGATVIEYEEDYSVAVKKGREQAENDPMSYFVDDENSKTLFLGYAVAALRLKRQFEEQNIVVDKNHPLYVYIPCGVGGAPGGVCFGLKEIFGDNCRVFFVEPVNSPCMLIGMATGLNSEISVEDFGLSGKTEADGLAVGRASGFVGGVMKSLLSGIMTVEDKKLFEYLRLLKETQDIEIEPSACAAFEGVTALCNERQYMEKVGEIENSIHIPWATGGRLVPREEMDRFLNTYL